MSLNRMVTKLALAFAAKKGVEMFRNAGGMSGLRDALKNRPSHGIGSSAARSGPLDGLLQTLGGNQTAARSGHRQTASLAAMLSGLAQQFGVAGSPSVHEDEPERFAQHETLDRATARAVVRAMVHVARADGHVDPDEREVLNDIVQHEGQSAQLLLNEAISEPVDAKAVAAETPMAARKDVYTAARLVASESGPEEAAYLSQLRDALALSPADVSAIERDVFARGHAA